MTLNEKVAELIQTVKSPKFWGDHFVDSTILLAAFNTQWSTMETTLGGLSHAQSVDTRLNVGLTTYLGLGKVYFAGLKWSRKHFNKEEEGPEQRTHDQLFGAAFAATLGTTLYTIALAKMDPSKRPDTILGDMWWVVKPTTMGVVINYLFNGLVGAANNMGRALMTGERSDYLGPVNNWSAGAKRAIFALGIYGLIEADMAVYKVVPDTAIQKPVAHSVQITRENANTQLLQRSTQHPDVLTVQSSELKKYYLK